MKLPRQWSASHPSLGESTTSRTAASQYLEDSPVYIARIAILTLIKNFILFKKNGKKWILLL
jgi:hypothetical protein